MKHDNDKNMHKLAEMHAALLAGDVLQQQQRILQENPTLPPIIAIVLASDLAHAKVTEQAFKQGELGDPKHRSVFQHACWLMGSYARMDFAKRMWETGWVTADVFFEMLPGLWTSSDPLAMGRQDLLEMWQQAWNWNGLSTLWDSKYHLPADILLNVYRGQSTEVVTLGFSWTLSRNVAEKFARGAWARAVTTGYVYHGSLNATHILALLHGRGEQEVIVDPGWISLHSKQLVQGRV